MTYRVPTVPRLWSMKHVKSWSDGPVVKLIATEGTLDGFGRRHAENRAILRRETAHMCEAPFQCDFVDWSRFWQQDVVLRFDHVLPVGRGQKQYRHDEQGSVIKINHHVDPLPEAAPSGYRELVVVRDGLQKPWSMVDPDGNRVRWCREDMTASIDSASLCMCGSGRTHFKPSLRKRSRVRKFTSSLPLRRICRYDFTIEARRSGTHASEIYLWSATPERSMESICFAIAEGVSRSFLNQKRDQERDPMRERRR